jgi:hypothetical protein
MPRATTNAPTIEDIAMRNMRHILVRHVGWVAALALGLAGCAERSPESARSGFTAPTTVLRSSTGAALVLSCPAMPGMSRRGVAAGSAGDANGNGVVCEQRVGRAGGERTLVTDDVVMPAAAVRR